MHGWIIIELLNKNKKKDSNRIDYYPFFYVKIIDEKKYCAEPQYHPNTQGPVTYCRSISWLGPDLR